MVETLKCIWEEFLGRFLDFILSYWLDLEEKFKLERRLRVYCSRHGEELEIEEN